MLREVELTICSNLDETAQILMNNVTSRNSRTIIVMYLLYGKWVSSMKTIRYLKISKYSLHYQLEKSKCETCKKYCRMSTLRIMLCHENWPALFSKTVTWNMEQQEIFLINWLKTFFTSLLAFLFYAFY